MLGDEKYETYVKHRHEFEEDRLYEMENEVRENLNYALHHNHISIDDAQYILDHPEEWSEWLWRGCQ